MSNLLPHTQEEWTAHNQKADEDHKREHGPESHDCPREFGRCYEDPECEFALCETCRAPNKHCVCDFLYEQAHGK